MGGKTVLIMGTMDLGCGETKLAESMKKLPN